MGSEGDDVSDVLSFLRDLLSTPSLPGEEGEAARRVVAEMEALGYDEVRTDDAGNVLGVLRGAGRAPSVMLNTHLDHVDAGDPDAWPHPPFGGEIHDGRVWGRGAVDIKGPLAAQVHSVGRLADGERPDGDVWVTATVQNGGAEQEVDPERLTTLEKYAQMPLDERADTLGASDLRASIILENWPEWSQRGPYGDEAITTSMTRPATLRVLPESLVDRTPALSSIYPASWLAGTFELWRLDWLLTTEDVAVHRYELLGADGHSDHRPQRVVLSVTGLIVRDSDRDIPIERCRVRHP
jgi:hypothetical protein